MPEEATTEARRVTVTLRPRDIKRIEEIASETSLKANDIIRRALATESFVVKNRREGRKILIQDEKGTLREVEFLY